jgi:hypothetical protein
MRDKFREALFNEIKGSLFEYLTAREIARAQGLEANFLRSLPEHYQAVLEQQDRMTQELYSELADFLPIWSKTAAQALLAQNSGLKISGIELVGQFIHTTGSEDVGEADFILKTSEGLRPVSLKLNKRQGSVNTKSAGIKSLLTQYFPVAHVETLQANFNALVDSEFGIVHDELYRIAGLPEANGWEEWRKSGLTELPGELPEDMRERLHAFYARVSQALEVVLKQIAAADPVEFREGLLKLAGFGSTDLWQLICFHDIYGKTPEKLTVMMLDEASVRERVASYAWREHGGKASSELMLGDWLLQIRVKPMNKFTTTAIKMNCSIRY